MIPRKKSPASSRRHCCGGRLSGRPGSPECSAARCHPHRRCRPGRRGQRRPGTGSRRVGDRGNDRPAHEIREDRRHRRSGPIRDARSAEGELQRLGPRLRPRRLPEGAGGAGQDARSDRGARPECHGGGAVLPGDLLVFDAQGPWRNCVFGAATRQEHAGQSHRASAMGQHHQVYRLPVLSRARNDRDPHHPQGAGRIPHLRGGLGAPHPVRAGFDPDDDGDRPARCAARVQIVRRLDRSDRGR